MRKPLVSAYALFLTLSITLASASVVPKHEQISKDLAKHASSSALDVIVQYRHTPVSRNYTHAAKVGAVQKSKLHFIKAAAFHVPASALTRLASDPDVIYISPDRKVNSLLSNAAPAINAPYAWSFGYDGTGIGVAIVDSGISGHDDLKDSSGHNRIVYNANFASDSGTNDVYGHGEHVAGIVGGTGKDSICNGCFSVIKGIAPNTTLINLRALDKNGEGTDSSVIAAINELGCQYRSPLDSHQRRELAALGQ